MFNDSTQIQTALKQLGRKIAQYDLEEVHFLICGGAALSLIGTDIRPTKDVDILAILSPSKDSLIHISDELLTAIHATAKELGLAIDWLNDAAANISGKITLPEGIEQRAQQLSFGPCLKISVISRQDQISLKMFASISDSKSQRHLKDLEALKPTSQELKIAAQWLNLQNPSEAFKHRLKELITIFSLEAENENLEQKPQPKQQRKL